MSINGVVLGNMKKVYIVIGLLIGVLLIASFIPVFAHSGLRGDFKLNFWQHMQWLRLCGGEHVVCD